MSRTLGKRAPARLSLPLSFSLCSPRSFSWARATPPRSVAASGARCRVVFPSHRHVFLLLTSTGRTLQDPAQVFAAQADGAPGARRARDARAGRTAPPSALVVVVVVVVVDDRARLEKRAACTRRFALRARALRARVVRELSRASCPRNFKAGDTRGDSRFRKRGSFRGTLAFVSQLFRGQGRVRAGQSARVGGEAATRGGTARRVGLSQTRVHVSWRRRKKKKKKRSSCFRLLWRVSPVDVCVCVCVCAPPVDGSR